MRMRSPIRTSLTEPVESASERRPQTIAQDGGSARGLAMKVKLPGAAESQCPLRTSARRSPYKPACDRPCDRRPRGHRGDLPHRRTAQRERLTPSVPRPWADSNVLRCDNRAASAMSVMPPVLLDRSNRVSTWRPQCGSDDLVERELDDADRAGLDQLRKQLANGVLADDSLDREPFLALEIRTRI
jgi:hypothetical protein